MLEYDPEISADQIFHWLKEELASGRQRITCRATCKYVADELNGEHVEEVNEDTGVHSMSTMATLEISPASAADGWMLKVFAEDVVGPHVPEDSSVPGGPEEIELDDFFTKFIAPDSGAVFVSVSAESEAAKAQFDSLLSEMTEDRHIA